MGRKARDQVASARRIIDMQHDMDADIGFGAGSQDQRLNIVKIEGDAFALEAIKKGRE